MSKPNCGAERYTDRSKTRERKKTLLTGIHPYIYEGPNPVTPHLVICESTVDRKGIPCRVAA